MPEPTESGAPLSPTDAQRLSRLRVMLMDAQRRAEDSTELGRHLAVVALDGVGEMAMGLCLHQITESPPSGSVPKMLNRLEQELGPKWTRPGVKGFRELHGVRNTAQHEGVPPAAGEIPRWAAETEVFVRSLVAATFGVELREVYSAAAVISEPVRDLLARAERSLEAGDAVSAFDDCWDAMQRALSENRSRAALDPLKVRSRLTSGVALSDEVGQAVQELEARIEISTFTSEPEEWLWLYAQRAEEMRGGAPPEIQDARRALVFVLGWVMRSESFASRHPGERWEEHQRERFAVPVTGVPGGPHIQLVTRTEEPNSSWWGKKRDYWVFQLTDAPENDLFPWAVSQAAREAGYEGEESAVRMWLGAHGRLEVVSQVDASADEIYEAVDKIIRRAPEVLEARMAADAEYEAEDAALIAPHEKALREAGVPFVAVSVRSERNGYRDVTDPEVMVELENDDGNLNYLGAAIDEARSKLTAGDESAQMSASLDWVRFAPDLDPELGARWIADALKIRDQKFAAEQEVQDREKEDSGEKLESLKRLVAGRGAD